MTNTKEVVPSLTLQLYGTPASVTSAANRLSTGNGQEVPAMQIRVLMFITGCKTQMALNMSQRRHFYALYLVRWGPWLV